MRVLMSDMEDLDLDFSDIGREINIFSCFSLAILTFVFYLGKSNAN